MVVQPPELHRYDAYHVINFDNTFNTFIAPYYNTVI